MSIEQSKPAEDAAKDQQAQAAEDDNDFPLGQACDRFDPTCESCQ